LSRKLLGNVAINSMLFGGGWFRAPYKSMATFTIKLKQCQCIYPEGFSRRKRQRLDFFDSLGDKANSGKRRTCSRLIGWRTNSII